MKFVIRLTSVTGGKARVGWYVSRSGSRSSYTPRLEDARTFGSRDDAERECCENERVVDALTLIGAGS